MGQQVLDIQYSAYVVVVVLIHGDAAVIVFEYAGEHLGKRAAYVDVYYVLPAGHYLLGGLVAKSDDTLQDALLILDVVLVGQLKRLFQVVYAQALLLLMNDLLQKYAALDEDGLDGPEQAAHEHDATDRLAAVSQGGLPAVYLGHYLAKEQQQKSKDNCEADKLYPHGLGPEGY